MTFKPLLERKRQNKSALKYSRYCSNGYTSRPVGRPKYKNKSRCRLSVERPVYRKIQRAKVLQSGKRRSTARSTVKRAHRYALLPEPRSTGTVDRLNLAQCRSVGRSTGSGQKSRLKRNFEGNLKLNKIVLNRGMYKP